MVEKLFDNCLIQAPDGVNLSRCGRKKIKWYLDRSMADLVSEDPPTIRLRFEPSGRRGLEDPYLLCGKPNVCVVCGTDSDLTRHHIIPYCFIRHMSVEYKMDIIRDIFPLCRPCHDDYEKKSFKKKTEMSEAMGRPMCGIDKAEIAKIRRATGAAAALMEHAGQIPEPRNSELRRTVAEFLGVDEVGDEELLRARKHRISERPDYVHFSKHVAETVTDYDSFAEEWRTHFVESMEPKHMPPEWRVDRRCGDIWVPERMIALNGRPAD